MSRESVPHPFLIAVRIGPRPSRWRVRNYSPTKAVSKVVDGVDIWTTGFVGDAHRDDGKRFVVHGDEKLTAFLELESAIRTCGELA